MSAPDAGTAAAGWYPDPYAQATYRWFDGAVWTAQVHDVTPVAPAVPPAATSVPFVADPTLGATTTAGYSAAGASTASGSRFGTPTYADQTVHGGTTRSGYAPGGYAPGSGYAGGYAAGAASPAYGTVAPFGVAQPMSYAAPHTNRRALVGAAVLAVVVVAAALAAPHVFPRLAHHTLAMTAPDTLAGAAVDTSADGQARLDQVRPTLQQAFSQLPEHPVAVTQLYSAPPGGPAGERLLVFWATSSATFSQDSAASTLIAGMQSAAGAGDVVKDATDDGGTLGCLMPQQYGGAIVGCVWARSGTGVIVVDDVGGSLDQARAHTIAIVKDLLR